MILPHVYKVKNRKQLNLQQLTPVSTFAVMTM